MAAKKPVGILHVKVVRGMRLLKKDILGSSDPYVKLGFSGERLKPKRTSVQMKNLNPEWNEKFKLIVTDPQLQALELQVYDWDKVFLFSFGNSSLLFHLAKLLRPCLLTFPFSRCNIINLSALLQVGGHDRIGMQLVPLKLLTPNEMKEFTLDLVKNMNINDPQNKKRRGKLVVELTYVHFKTDSFKSNGNGNIGFESKECEGSRSPDEGALGGAGLLLVMIQAAEDVEGEHHSNPYALIRFRGEKRKTKVSKHFFSPDSCSLCKILFHLCPSCSHQMIKKTRDPIWNEEFQFMLEEPPLHEKIYIEVLSKRTGIHLRSKVYILSKFSVFLI